MPVVILVTDDDIVPGIFSEATDFDMLNRLNGLEVTPQLTEVSAARDWLIAQKEPSGWFDSIEQARAYIARLKDAKTFDPAEIKQARDTLGLSRAALYFALGFEGNSNTGHKTIMELELGRDKKGNAKSLTPDRARRLRALLAEHAVKG